MHTVLELSDFAVIAFLTLVPFFVIAAILGVHGSGSGVNLKLRERMRLARIEAKVDLLLKHSGVVFDNNAIERNSSLR
jgi:hypothetical protein